ASFSNVFFAGRRRHTRFSRDGSSDVCSSDLQRQVRLQEYVACRVRLPSATFTVRRPSGILVKPGGLQCRRSVDPPIMDGDETGLLRAGPARGGATGERTRV